LTVVITVIVIYAGEVDVVLMVCVCVCPNIRVWGLGHGSPWHRTHTRLLAVLMRARVGCPLVPSRKGRQLGKNWESLKIYMQTKKLRKFGKSICSSVHF